MEQLAETDEQAEAALTVKELFPEMLAELCKREEAGVICKMRESTDGCECGTCV